MTFGPSGRQSLIKACQGLIYGVLLNIPPFFISAGYPLPVKLAESANHAGLVMGLLELAEYQWG